MNKEPGLRVLSPSHPPTLYAVCGDEESADVLATAVEEKFGFQQAGEVMVTSGENAGAVLSRSGVEVRV